LIFNLLPAGREHNKQLEILHGFSRKVLFFFFTLLFVFVMFEKVIEERLTAFNVEHRTDQHEEKKSTRRLAFLDSLIAQMHAEKLSFEDIQEEVDTFMFEV
jgi:hypothetical protein